MTVEILIGDVRARLRDLPDDHFDCVVTSPPYWGLRDYGVEGQLGMERTLGEHLEAMVEVFDEVRRVMKPEGTLWLNYGDCYATSPNGRSAADTKAAGTDDRTFRDKPFSTIGAIGGDPGGLLKAKDLCMVPNRLAIALQQPRYTGRIKSLEDRVWLAAMVDGEGCLFVHKRKKGQHNGCGYHRTNDSYSVGLEVSNTCEAILQRCLSITGQGSICRQDKDRRQPLYRWNLRTNQCREVLREIYPHLVAKKHEARLLLGCPSSGKDAELAHSSVIALHNGQSASIDFKEPESMFSPGWWVRSEIIWGKNNPMPDSSGRYRPSTAHEKIFLLTKSAKSHYDSAAVRMPATGSGTFKVPDGWDQDEGTHGRFHREGRAKGNSNGYPGSHGDGVRKRTTTGNAPNDTGDRLLRNYEPDLSPIVPPEVWQIPTAGYQEAHFATFPPALVTPCILAGSPKGGRILDPFGGAGTTGLVAERLGRECTLIELKPEYAEMARSRLRANLIPVECTLEEKQPEIGGLFGG